MWADLAPLSTLCYRVFTVWWNLRRGDGALQQVSSNEGSRICPPLPSSNSAMRFHRCLWFSTRCIAVDAHTRRIARTDGHRRDRDGGGRRRRRRRRRGAPTGWWRAATWIEPWPSGAAERPSPSPHVRGRAPAARCRLVWRCDTRNRIVCLVIRSMAIRGEIRALGFYSHCILKHVRGGSLSILF